MRLATGSCWRRQVGAEPLPDGLCAPVLPTSACTVAHSPVSRVLNRVISAALAAIVLTTRTRTDANPPRYAPSCRSSAYCHQIDHRLRDQLPGFAKRADKRRRRHCPCRHQFDQRPSTQQRGTKCRWSTKRPRETLCSCPCTGAFRVAPCSAPVGCHAARAPADTPCARHASARTLWYALVLAHCPDLLAGLEAEDSSLPAYWAVRSPAVVSCAGEAGQFLRRRWSDRWRSAK
jgi:hypothetical protein